MRTKSFALIAMLLYILAVQAAEKTWHLVTDKGDAIELSNVSYLLAASTESLDIVCKDGTTINGVSGISLEERESTGIKPINTGEAMFSQVVGDQIYISYAKAGTTAEVLSLSGIIHVSQTLTDGQNIINVSKLRSGTYILKVGETSIKFIKK